MYGFKPYGYSPHGIVTYSAPSGGDTTPPVLTNPTGVNSGKYSATGTVTTDEANGTLYYITTTSASATAASVKAGSSQSVTAAGVQNISITGLTANTTYYNHYLHRDAAGNDSTVSSSPSYTTQAEAAPTGTVTIGSITVGQTTASVPYTYSASDADSFDYRIDGGTIQNTVANPISLTGLTTSTAYTIEIRAKNLGGVSAWSAVANFTTTSSATGTITLTDLCNNAGAPIASQAGIICDVYNQSTGALVVRKTGLTSTSGADIIFSDAAITPTSIYTVVITIGAAIGVVKVTAT